MWNRHSPQAGSAPSASLTVGGGSSLVGVVSCLAVAIVALLHIAARHQLLM